MLIIIIILTASYIWDDVRIVYALTIYDAIFFGDGRTDEQGDSRSRITMYILISCRILICSFALCGVHMPVIEYLKLKIEFREGALVGRGNTS